MKGAPPAAYVAFSLRPTAFTAGRIRLRIPGCFRDKAFFSSVAEFIHDLPHVLNVSTNPRTTSVLVEYDGVEEDLLESFRYSGLFVLMSRNQMRVRDRFGGLPTFSEKEKATMKVLALIALSGVQVARGHALGAGTSLLDEAMRYWDSLATINAETGRRNG